MGYTTFKPFWALGGVYDFPVGICFARCYRRFQSSLFCTRAMTFWIFTMSSVFLFLSLDDLAQLLHFFHHHLLLHIVPFFGSMSLTWRNCFSSSLLSYRYLSCDQRGGSEQESMLSFLLLWQGYATSYLDHDIGTRTKTSLTSITHQFQNPSFL